MSQSRTFSDKPWTTHPRLWGVLLGLPVAVALILLALPYFVQWYLSSWLRDQGVVNVTIDDVDLNPFTGTFAIRSLAFEDEDGGNHAEHAFANLNWTDLLNRRIRFTEVTLTDAELRIRRTESNRWLLGTIVVGAQAAVTGAEQSEAKSGWGIGIDSVRFEDVSIDYRDPLLDRSLMIEDLAIDNFASWDPAQSTTINVELSDSDARLVTTGSMRPFADTFDLALDIDGDRLQLEDLTTLLQPLGVESIAGQMQADLKITVQAPPDGATSLDVAGRVSVNNGSLTHAADQINLAGMNWDGDVSVGLFGDTNTVASDGTLQLDQFNLASSALSADLESITWRGAATAELGEEGEALTFNGTLSTAVMELVDDSQFSTRLKRLSWQGELTTTSLEDWKVRVGGEVNGEGFNAGYRSQPVLIDLAALRIPLAGPGEDLALGNVVLTDLKLFERIPTESGDSLYMASLADLNISGLRFSDDVVAVGQITLHDLQMWLERSADGVLETFELSNRSGEPGIDDGAAQPANPSVNADGSDPDQSLEIVFSGVNTTGKSSLTFVDRSVRPVMRAELTPISLAVGELDSRKPDQDTPVGFSASQGRYGELAFSGNTRPLAGSIAVNGTGTVTDLNMITLNGFARRAIGYTIESGTLSADIEVDLLGQQLDSQAALTLRRLEIKPLKAEDQDEFSAELGVPLGTALGLLEDGERTIQLNIPLRGDLDDLSVGVGHAVQIVIQKGLLAGMRTAATTYFAPLWPALAASKLFAAASKLRFQSVTFNAGEFELGIEQLTYIQNMAELLAKRPKVNLSLCGRAVAEDIAQLFPEAGELDEAQAAAMNELSKQRQEAAKDALIEAGIGSARLVTCAPDADVLDTDAPRVEFGV